MLKKLENFLFFLCLLVLPTQLGKHFWPSFSFVYSLPVDYLSPTLYFWNILAAILLVVWIINKTKINKLALNLYLLLILSQLFSIFGAVNKGASFVGLSQIAFAGIFGVLIASLSWEKIKKPFFWSLLSATLFESLLALFQFFSTHSLGLWILGERTFSVSTPAIATFDFFGAVFLRPYGTFSHPNVLAAFMVLVLPILWQSRVLSLTSPSRPPRFAAVAHWGAPVRAIRYFFGKFWLHAVILLGAVTVLLSFSRAAIVVLVIEAILLFRKKWKLLLIPLVVLGPLLWIRFNSAFNFDYLSILRREELDLLALSQFWSSPLFGIGLNNFIVNAASSSLIAGPTRFLQPAHNIVLLSLAETGIVGFLGWLALVGVAIKKRWIDKENQISKLFLFSWATILFLGMFDHFFLTLPQGQRLLFLIWGLSLGI